MGSLPLHAPVVPVPSPHVNAVLIDKAYPVVHVKVQEEPCAVVEEHVGAFPFPGVVRAGQTMAVDKQKYFNIC